LNAANEIAVSAFLSGKLGFMQIPKSSIIHCRMKPLLKIRDWKIWKYQNAQARITSQSFIKKFTK
jgi:1-deoxy-D-xylulose 5-phosphate reductoisomerase